MVYLPPQFIVLLALLAFVLGACVASFINCAALRRQQGESVFRGRSHCPHCGEALGPGELIPILSWFLLSKKCRHCGAPISVRYPAVECIGGLAFALIVTADCLRASGVALVGTAAVSAAGGLGSAAPGSAALTSSALMATPSELGLVLHIVQLLLFASILLYASLVDIDSRTIPDACIVAAVVVRVVYIALAGGVLGLIDTHAVARDSLIGAFAIGVPLLLIVLVADRVLGRDSMGGGDIKLFFVAGLYFGWQACLFLIMIACILGIVAALINQRKALKEYEQRASVLEEVGFEGEAEELNLRAQPITFGPAIAAACVITMVVGPELVGWYAGLF